MTEPVVVPAGLFLIWIQQLVVLLVPISGFLMIAPVFGNAMVPVRVKAAVSLAIALALRPLMPEPATTEIVDLMLLTAWQLVAAIGLGFATLVFFQMFVIAGQFIGMQMGLGFAAMVDPGNGIQVTVWSQFYLMLATLTLLAVDGHLVALEVLLEGLKLAPTLVVLDATELGWELARLGGWMFAGGASIALPVVFSLLVVNLAFGVMSRSAPQLNVFSLGFPFSLLFGLLLVWWSLRSWLVAFDREQDRLMSLLSGWVG